MASLTGDGHLSAVERGPTLLRFPANNKAHSRLTDQDGTAKPRTTNTRTCTHTSVSGENMLLYLMEPQIHQWQLVGYPDKGPGASLGLCSKQERHKGNIAQKPPEPPATGQKLSAAGSMISCRQELNWPFFKHYWHTVFKHCEAFCGTLRLVRAYGGGLLTSPYAKPSPTHLGSCRRGSSWILGKVHLRKNNNALAQAAKGSGTVTMPGGIQEKGRCRADGHDLERSQA